MILKIRKWGKSQGLLLPRKLLSDSGLSINDRVNVEIIDKKIVIYKAQDDELRLSEVFAENRELHRDAEIDWGKPTGCEVW